MSDKQINDGGPAFPGFPEILPVIGQSDCWFRPADYGEVNNGMTLRDYFAAKALAFFTCDTAQTQLEVGIRERHAEMPEADRRRLGNEIIAKRCYMLADSMLAERQKGGA